MIPQSAQYTHSRFADVLLLLTGGLCDHSMMMTGGCSGFLDGIQNALLQFKILIDIADLGDETKGKVVALGIGEADVGHANGMRLMFAITSHPELNFIYLNPVNVALKRANYNVVIHQVFPNKKVGETTH